MKSNDAGKQEGAPDAVIPGAYLGSGFPSAASTWQRKLFASGDWPVCGFLWRFSLTGG
jgi:hypothetical protein